jgi:DNA-directed RNA polymerase subunit omega
VPNRFELVLLGAERARELCAAAAPFVDAAPDKATVTALREIALGYLSLDRVRANCGRRLLGDRTCLEAAEEGRAYSSERGQAMRVRQEATLRWEAEEERRAQAEARRAAERHSRELLAALAAENRPSKPKRAEPHCEFPPADESGTELPTGVLALPE